MKRALFCFLLLAGLGGCAVNQGEVEVKYAGPVATSTVPGASSVTIDVVPKDGRVINSDRVSTKRNGYGMKMAKIIATNDVATEVSSAVATELSAMGFKTGPGGVKIVVETIIFYNDFDVHFFSVDCQARVAFNLVASSSAGKTIYTHSYDANITRPFSGLSPSDSTQAALDEALAKAVQQVIADRDLHDTLVRDAAAADPAPVS